jgi:epoxyqueuosine reductase
LGGAGLADELRRIALGSGLDRVGICDARPFLVARREIENRRRQGLAAGMQFTYRNPVRSTDPAATMPDGRALLVGARYYRRDPPPGPPAGNPPQSGPHPTGRAGRSDPDPGGPRGRVARYSWVDHYQPLRAALGAVAATLIDEGWQAKVLVDDNALVDRAAAVRAGLGWYGKNANVLIPGAGSWFVLGSVLTDAPIAPREAPVQVPDGCGTCRRCLADCPTGALVAPGRLDARRCLAWLLQAPGVFPVEQREALGDRIYGCDECQERCPANRRGERVAAGRPAEPGSQASIPVLAILAAGDEELEEMVGRWYIPGREMRYVRRNALVVLGNVGRGDDPPVAAALDRALESPDPLIRAHAVWAARKLGLGTLLAKLAGDNDPLVTAELSR